MSSSHEGDSTSHRPATLSSSEFDTNDGPVWFATRHFVETGVIVHRLGAEPHVVVVRPHGLVDRVSFNQRGTLLSGVCNGSREQCLRHTLAPVFGRHDKANH